MTPGLRGIARVSLRGLLALLALLGVLMLAWLASNVVDDRDQPVPAALALPPNPPGSPLFFAVQGLLAPPGEAPEAVGRREWLQAAATGRGPDVGQRPRLIEGLPLDCRAPQDCAQLLAASLPQLGRQLAPAALLGQRCGAALAGDQRYEEHLPARLHAASPLPAYSGAVQCALWLSGQAVLAASRADRDAALRRLREGRQLAEALLVGCRMLVCEMVAVRMMELQLQGLGAVALLRPAWSADLIALLLPLPPQALAPGEWLKTEHALMRGSLDDLIAECGGGLATMLLGVPSRALDLAGHWACKGRIGLLPQATRRAMDERWLRVMASAGPGLDAALDHAIAQRQSGLAAPRGLAWRNTLGMALVGVLEGAPHDEYFARQADAELHRQALRTVLAVQVQRVPPAERATWLDRQDLPARLRSRLAWVDEGARLQVRPWLAELNADHPRAAAYRLAVPG